MNTKVRQARQLMTPRSKKVTGNEPTAVFKCSYCLNEKHVRGHYAPPELMCLHCGRRVRPKIKGVPG